MSNQEKLNQMYIDLKEMLDNDEIEEALTILSMMKNAQNLEKWLSE